MPAMPVLEFDCTCTYPGLPVGFPSCRRVRVFEEDVSTGNLVGVQTSAYDQFWGGKREWLEDPNDTTHERENRPRKQVHKPGSGHASSSIMNMGRLRGQDLPLPLFVFTPFCNVPLTSRTLPGLLGDSEMGLEPIRELIIGPRWTSGHSLPPCTPSPQFHDLPLYDPSKSVGRLYQCESIDNSIQALKARQDNSQSRQLHVYLVPRSSGCTVPFMCTLDNGVGLNSKEDMAKSFKYGYDPHAGTGVSVCNDQSQFGFVDGHLGRFGLGHQKAAYKRGSTLSKMSRGEGSSTVIEGTKDIVDGRNMYYNGDELGSFRPVVEERHVISGPSHKDTCSNRGQAWEHSVPEMRDIVRQADREGSFFLEIVSRLYEDTEEHLTSISPLEIFKEFSHMYFYYTQLPTHSAPPFNLGYAYGPLEMHLHVAKGEAAYARSRQDGRYHNFRLDMRPWGTWPEGQPNEEEQHRECVPARLLRLVKANSTFAPPHPLPSGHTVSDGFYFGFTHKSMREPSGASPIHLVKLHYLPNDGCTDLKGTLGLTGYGHLRYQSASRLADVHFQGRLIPYALPIEEIRVLTEAVQEVLRRKGLPSTKDRARSTIKSRVFGQVFLQGAGVRSLVDSTKFQYGELNTSALLKDEGLQSVDMSYYAVKIHQGKQSFREFSMVPGAPLTRQHLHEDLVEWYCTSKDTFEKEYIVGPEPLQQGLQRLLDKCPKCDSGSAYRASLTYPKKGGREEGPGRLSQGDLVQTNITSPILYQGETRSRTPVKVLAFRVKKGAGAIGSRTNILVQLMPEEVFGEKVQEYAVGRFLKDIWAPISDSGSNYLQRSLMPLCKLQLRVQVCISKDKWSDVAKIDLKCSNDEHPVQIRAFLPPSVANEEKRGNALTQWLDPTFKHSVDSKKRGAEHISYNTHPLFSMTQTIYSLDGAEVVEPTKEQAPQGDAFHFTIPAAVLGEPRALKASYRLKHHGRLFAEESLPILVEAGPPDSLRAHSDPVCQLGESFSFHINCLDARKNVVPFRSGEIVPEASHGLSLQIDSIHQSKDGGHLIVRAKLLASHEGLTYLAQQFGCSSAAPKTVLHQMQLHLLREPRVSGQLNLHIRPGPPAKLVPIQDVSQGIMGHVENGGRLPQTFFVVKDSHDCAVNLADVQGAGQWWSNFCIKGLGSSDVEERCSIEGCHITTPDVVAYVGRLESEKVLQWKVHLIYGNLARVESDTYSTLLQRSNKPHMIEVKFGDYVLEPLTDNQRQDWSRRASDRMHGEATRAAARDQKGNSPAFLLKYPNACREESKPVNGLSLSLYSDNGRWGIEDNDVNLYVRPTERKKFLLDNEQASGFMAPALMAPAHFYWVNCYRAGEDGGCSFFLIIAAIEPPPVAWQCRSVDAAGTASRRLTRQSASTSAATPNAAAQPVGEVLEEMQARVQQPLCELVHVCPVAEDGSVVSNASSTTLTVRLEQASAVVRLVSGSALQLHSLQQQVEQRQQQQQQHEQQQQQQQQQQQLVPQWPGQAVPDSAEEPTKWADDLCLVGHAGAQCTLLFEGGRLLPARLSVTLDPGHPKTFTLHGLPGCPEISCVLQLPLLESQWSCHQGLKSLIIIPRDACGNATAIPDQSYSVSLVKQQRARQQQAEQGVSSLEVVPSSSLQLKPHRDVADGPERLVLAQPDQCRVHASPQVANFRVELALGESRCSRELRVHVQGNGGFVSRVQVQAVPSLAAGEDLQQPLAQVQLFNDLGEQITGQELQQLCRGLQAKLGQDCLTCCIKDSKACVQLARAPTRAGRYELHVSYEEKREAQVEALQGSSTVVRLQPPLHISVGSVKPEKLELISYEPDEEIVVGSVADSLLLKELRLHLVDQFSNPTGPQEGQSAAIHLSARSSDSSVSAQPTLTNNPASVDSQGRACFRDIRFKDAPTLSSGAGSATFMLQASVQGVPRACEIPFTVYNSALRSQQEIQATLTAQKQQRLQDIQSSMQSIQEQGRQVLEEMETLMKPQPGTPQHVISAANVVRNAQSQQIEQALSSVQQAIEELREESSGPLDSPDTAAIRQCLRDFSRDQQQSANKVCGLALDLLTCMVTPGSDLHRLLSWRLGPSILHTVVVKDPATLESLSSFAANRHMGLSIRVLSWLNKYIEPPRFQLDQSETGSTEPFYLEDRCSVADFVPARSRKALLASLVGQSIVLATFQDARQFRSTQVSSSRACPELLSLDGRCITEAGDVLSASCPPQADDIRPMLGTSPPSQRLISQLPKKMDKLQKLKMDHDELHGQQSRLSTLDVHGLETGSQSGANELGESSRAAEVRRNIEQAGTSSSEPKAKRRKCNP